MVLLEVCVDSPAGIDAAVAGGADRLELCAALELGGLTPSPALLARALASAVPARAMVRPRGGDFAYDAAELDLAVADALALLRAGAAGLVFGAVRDGVLDEPALRRFVAAVRAQRPDAGLTLHRAADATGDPVAAVGVAARLGFDCVLTAGGARTAPDGAAAVRRMREAAGPDGPTVMAGSGVRAENVAALLRATGVGAVHASASRPVRADARAAALGFADPPRRTTDAAAVRALRHAIDEGNAT